MRALHDVGAGTGRCAYREARPPACRPAALWGGIVNAIEAAWQALVASFEQDPWEGFERLDEGTESLLSLNAARDRMSAASISALLDAVDCDGVLFGSDSHPCVRGESECAEFAE